MFCDHLPAQEDMLSHVQGQHNTVWLSTAMGAKEMVA